MQNLKSQLLLPIVSGLNEESVKKITVVGCGQVGMAAAFSILVQNVCKELALIDVCEERLQGEMMDLQHGQQFVSRCKIRASSDYSVSADSNIVIVTAGARQREGETRLNLVQRNVDIFKGIIPKIVHNSPNCMIIVVANPVDILAYVAWKISGFPKNRVFGSGTMLDSARFRFFLGEKLGINPKSCHGYVIGEHGDSSVAVWSAINIGGVNLKHIKPDIGTDRDTENFSHIHNQVISSAYEVIKLKGYTSWAIGLTISSLCSSILNDENNILPLSIYAKGAFGIDKEVFVSLPILTSKRGVTNILTMNLNEDENIKLINSVNTLSEIINSIQW